MNSENHEICLDVMISYEEVVIKKIENVLQKLWRMLIMKRSILKKFKRIVQDSLSFWVKVTIELRFDFKTFCIGKSHDGLFHVKLNIDLECNLFSRINRG